MIYWLYVIPFSPQNSVASVDVPKDDVLNTCPTLEKCSHGTFLSVTELSSGGQKLSGLATVDMVYAFSSFKLDYINYVCSPSLATDHFVG